MILTGTADPQCFRTLKGVRKSQSEGRRALCGVLSWERRFLYYVPIFYTSGKMRKILLELIELHIPSR